MLTADSERLSEVEETTELGDIVTEEDLEAIVNRDGSADFELARLGGEAIYETVKEPVEGIAAVVLTCPTIECWNSKRAPPQHPNPVLICPSCSPQHQNAEYEPFFTGQGYRLLKL